METNRVICGDVRDVLPTLPDECVDMCVTSPPYWNLRNYGVDGQLGLEKTPEEFIANLVAVCDQIKRILKHHGTFWLNIGDSYAANRTYQVTDNKHISVGNEKPSKVPDGLKPKDMCLIPFKLAIALQEAGWWVRSDIIWYKRNPMPESVTDRPTKAHEYIFLLTKSAKYYYDAEAVKEENTTGSIKRFGNGNSPRKRSGKDGSPYECRTDDEVTQLSGRNLRTVWDIDNDEWSDFMEYREWKSRNSDQTDIWDITTKGYKGAHFATFPPEIPERCIKAGTSEKGNCAGCGKPWKRVVEKGDKIVPKERRNTQPIEQRSVKDKGWSNEAGFSSGTHYEYKTIGWEKTCRCETYEISKPIVLDPFMGSGTTAWVARNLGRDYLGIELNQSDIDNLIYERLSQQTLEFTK